MERGRGHLGFIAVAMFASAVAAAQPESREEMAGVGITEKLDGQVPLDTEFTDHNGKAVRLGDYLSDGKPVVISLVYYRCPGLCSVTLTGVSDVVRKMDWKPGEKYHVLTVSFNPEEGPDLGVVKRANYLSEAGLPSDAKGWTFLTADAANIAKLTRAVGFNYRWVEESKEWAHSAAAIVVTPQGRISRYLQGAYYDPETLRLAVVEASSGKIGSLSDKVWMKICGYDASQGRYVVMARSVLAIGGALTVGALVMTIGLLFARENSQRKKASARDGLPHAV